MPEKVGERYHFTEEEFIEITEILADFDRPIVLNKEEHESVMEAQRLFNLQQGKNHS